MRLQNNKKKKVTLNITSLIDVVLLLLIFFMLTTKFVEQKGMKLDLPQAKSFDSSSSKEIELIIDESGKMMLNGKEIEMDNLVGKLTEILPDYTEKTLVLKADKQLAHGKVVKIMDIARSNGLEKIVIATDAE